MNNNLWMLYVAVLDNKVVCFDTNLTAFVNRFAKIEPVSKNYTWFYNRFRLDNIITHKIDNKDYHFQKLDVD